MTKLSVTEMRQHVLARKLVTDTVLVVTIAVIGRLSRKLNETSSSGLSNWKPEGEDLNLGRARAPRMA